MWNRAEDQVMLVLIRHGETQANRERRYLGKTDEGLSERGVERLLSYKEKNYYPRVDYLFASPMKRCLETAEVLYPGQCPVVIPEWEEIDFGRFEYKSYDELKDDAGYQAWIDSGGMLDFPGGESRKDFILRCKRGWERMWVVLRQRMSECGEKPACVGAVVHGGTIMALLSEYGQKEYFDCQASNGEGYLCRVKYQESEIKIVGAEKI